MPKPPLNIIFLISHDLGQHLGCYGAPDVRSPNIDRLAASGTRFENSFCTAPQCSPSRAALWTGRFPHANGVVGLTHAGFANDLYADEKHLVEILWKGGYETHLFGIQHEALSAERCGYDTVHPRKSAVAMADDFAAFMAGREPVDKPLFASIGFFEPHRPFPHDDVECLPPDQLTVPPYLPDIPEVREDLADIEASIASLDRAVGRIVDAIRRSALADNTLIIMTADHGIAFPHAKMTLYDKGIEVPFIAAGPGIPQGAVREEMISNIDVMPTLLEITGMPLPEKPIHGRSFAALLNGSNYIERNKIFAEKSYHTYYDPMRAVRTKKWKLIANFEFAPYQETSPDYFNNAKSYVEVAKAQDADHPRPYHPPFELYDLEKDPYELNNLAEIEQYKSTRNRLIVELRTWMQETGDPLLDGPMPQAAYRNRMAAFKKISN